MLRRRGSGTGLLHISHARRTPVTRLQRAPHAPSGAARSRLRRRNRLRRSVRVSAAGEEHGGHAGAAAGGLRHRSAPKREAPGAARKEPRPTVWPIEQPFLATRDLPALRPETAISRQHERARVRRMWPSTACRTRKERACDVSRAPGEHARGWRAVARASCATRREGSSHQGSVGASSLRRRKRKVLSRMPSMCAARRLFPCASASVLWKISRSR